MKVKLKEEEEEKKMEGTKRGTETPKGLLCLRKVMICFLEKFLLILLFNFESQQ